MKKWIFFFLLGSITPLLLSMEALVVRITGKVAYQVPGEAWVPAEAGQIIPSMAVISTGFRSEAVLQIQDSELFVQPLSRIRVEELRESPGTLSASLSLEIGGVRAQIRKGREKLDFRLTTPTTTAAVRGTEFLLSSQKIEVIEGWVEFSQGSSRVFVPGGSYSWAGASGPSNPLVGLYNKGKVNPVAGSMDDDRKFYFPGTFDETKGNLSLSLE